MTELRPEGLYVLYEGYMNEGDLDGVLSLYAADARFVLADGRTAEGLPAIRRLLTPFVAAGPVLQMVPRRVTIAGDVASLSCDWRLSRRLESGREEPEMAGVSHDVARRQPDGRWLYVIDEPGELLAGTQPGTQPPAETERPANGARDARLHSRSATDARPRRP
jgi:uncharacterized protein (TIGR02246 family)